ncbi:MAG: two-component system histidine kinase PnpS [Candidatus Loosdrechtia sp.]|uniref:HAMP domain-containing sensor histidine kinase n=1 Tax=Candidatus Loosdrechtia sp. TaxID=3101272 RepID=UPI003A6AF531|nr:MAG: ATP-binding protein [Candidatus Jettenia sp. AMX2]WKZ22056.1 MAG: ATP-binding protein [Candidatus Jettenia sp. AMX2]
MIKKHHIRLVKKNMEANAMLISQLVKRSLLKNDTEDVVNMCKILSRYLNIEVSVIDTKGKIIDQSGIVESSISDLGKETADTALHQKVAGTYFDDRSGLIYLTIPIKTGEEREPIVMVSGSLETDHAGLLTTVKTTILYMLPAFAVTGIIGFIIIRINTSPLVTISQIAQNFARGNFAKKVEIISSDEMGDLANAINAMGIELQSQMQIILDDKNKLDAILANMNDAIITTDLEERVLIVNQAANALFGIPKVNQNSDYLWEKIRNEKLRSSVKEVIRTQESKTFEMELSTPEKRLLQAHISPIRMDKNTYWILLVFHDITELRKLENTRKEFVANVSHELRTPLASIKGYVETLLDNASLDQEPVKEFLAIIMKHTRRLDNLIKDILELSKLDSHDLKIELRHLDIRPCLENIFSHYKEHCIQKYQTFELTVPPSLPSLETNEYMLHQLLTNLLDNAIKYTPAGGNVHLKVVFTNGYFLFEVSDTGIGIPKEHIPRIFERFYRVDPARSREMGGTGLGLSIVKHIVNLHHGSVRVESTPGSGSKFIITLPKQQTVHKA